MKTKYFPADFEDKWRAKWESDSTYKTGSVADAKKKNYVLDMFPYPSGAGLHAGHVRIYTASDLIARYFRMKGEAVLHPMGWDAFGLPAENAAIKAKKNPMDIVPTNIANFKRQMQMLGFSYDWDKEFSTTDPTYYKWTQWLFIQLFKMGLLYKKDTPVYFCPYCKTGLAEEEVLADGTHERCGNAIERRTLPQWIFRITEYADELLADLEGLDWPRGILEMQKNWIGRKEGINIEYQVDGTDDIITCFTTRPDTNFGATFIVLAPEHPFAQKVAKNNPDVKKYIEKSISKTDVERQQEGKKKSGVFTGHYVINNLNNKKLPVWVSDFVLAGVGTGAVVGVPGHDLRDFEFASAYDIEIVRVVEAADGDTSPITKSEQVQEEQGKMINSEFLDGMDIKKATSVIMDHLEDKGWGKRVVDYHLRDWVFSRQRYWGEPIPMANCEACKEKKVLSKELKNVKLSQDVAESLYGWFPVSESDLPVELPKVDHYEPSPDGKSPLANIKEWADVVCPECGSQAQRESDTMPNWAGSCWYYLRFADTRNEREAFDRDKIDKWLPVDWYIGGAEHAVLHLLYARFWHKALFKLGLVNTKEPFTKLQSVGLVLAADHRKMSKSWGNVVNPDDVVAEYGADALRVYVMFMAPFSQEIVWSQSALGGSHRFLSRIWQIYHNPDKIAKREDTSSPSLISALQLAIHKVGHDIESVKFNTGVSTMMEFLNAWDRPGAQLNTADAKKFLQILAPYAPYMTEELWQSILGEKGSIHLSKWPEAEREKIMQGDIKIPVQVNGKLRTVLMIRAAQADETTIVKKAEQDGKVAGYLEGKKYKVIYIKGKVLNLVVQS